MKGFHKRLLRIDLNTHAHTYEEIADEVLERTLGGKGLGTYLLRRENPRGVDPLGSESVFVITTGPVTGTRMWSQSRFAVFAKSPATGGYGESYCGGTLAPKIKGCGVDAVILIGRSPELSCLVIEEDGVRFLSAGDIRGAETPEAEGWLLQRAGEGFGAMVIGPAGENLVRLACIKSDYWRSLGRGGMGAVLGSKNIKGIAFNGTRYPDIADATLLRELIKTIARKGKEDPSTEIYQKYGTLSQVQVTNLENCFPTRYWSSGRADHWPQISAEYMVEHLDVTRNGCPNCFLQCTKKVRVREGRHAGLEIDGPEYETVYAFGGLNCIETLEEVAYLNDVCDRLGLDTMSAGNIAGLISEAYERGRIDYRLEYGDADGVAALLSEIAGRRGLGDILAEGIKSASEVLNLEDLAVHVKGLEPAGFDPRVLKGMGLSYATASRGACHLRGTFYKAELSKQIDKEVIAGKAELLVDYEDRAVLFDSLILCRFFRDLIQWDEIVGIVRAVTGLALTKKELQAIANRITNETRIYNRSEGLGPETDTLPPRLLSEANAEGAGITKSQLEQLIDEYNLTRAAVDDKNKAHG